MLGVTAGGGGHVPPCPRLNPPLEGGVRSQYIGGLGLWDGRGGYSPPLVEKIQFWPYLGLQPLPFPDQMAEKSSYESDPFQQKLYPPKYIYMLALKLDCRNLKGHTSTSQSQFTKIICRKILRTLFSLCPSKSYFNLWMQNISKFTIENDNAQAIWKLRAGKQKVWKLNAGTCIFKQKVIFSSYKVNFLIYSRSRS